MAISFVGSSSTEYAGGATTFNLSLPSGLQEGDLVLIITGFEASNSLYNPGVSTAGYTEIVDLYANDSNDINLSVNWKIMGATPDTVVACLGHTIGDSSACFAIAYALRGVDQTAPIDVTATSAVGVNGGIPNPPAIFPVTNGARIIICGASTPVGDATVTVPTGYGDHVIHATSVGTIRDCTVAVASKVWSGSGSEDPGAWTNWYTDTASSWAAATIAIRPFGMPPLIVSLDQLYSIEEDTIYAACVQVYGIASDFGEIALAQLYSIVLEVWLTQYYGGVPVIGRSLVQPYGNGSMLIKSLQQRWDHAPELEVILEQPWSLPDLLQAISVQSYGIVAEVLNLTCEQLYHINEHSTLFASLLQPYIIAEETARLYQFDTRLYINDERIPYHSLEWQAVDSEFVWSCDFSVKTRAVAGKCVDGAEITIVSAGDTWRLKCYDGWFLDKRFQSTVYRISGRSKSWDLSLATPLLGDIAGGMASEIVTALATPHGISVDWRMVDGYIADGRITANDQTPIEIIKDIVHDAGGIVLSSLDGNLLIVAEEETPVPDWPAATPAQTIHAVLERISTSESKDEQKGYNCFDISDQLANGETFRFEEERIDGRTKELRLFLVPLDPERKFVVTHSSDSQVTAEPFGIVSLQIDDELVEFRDGSGRTSKPVHGLSSVVWQKENLGGVSYSEDGILTSAVPGYSLLKVSYVTRYYKWIARDPRIEDVQFRAVEVAA